MKLDTLTWVGRAPRLSRWTPRPAQVCVVRILQFLLISIALPFLSFDNRAASFPSPPAQLVSNCHETRYTDVGRTGAPPVALDASSGAGLRCTNSPIPADLDRAPISLF